MHIKETITFRFYRTYIVFGIPVSVYRVKSIRLSKKKGAFSAEIAKLSCSQDVNPC